MQTQKSESKLDKIGRSSILEKCAEILTYIFIIITFPFSIYLCLVIVPDFSRLVILRNGRLRLNNPKGPGIVFILPCIDEYYVIDLRCLIIDILPQEILTKDSVSIYVNGVVYFHIKDPIKVITQVKHFTRATELLAQTSLRNAIGKLDLHALITQKENVGLNLTNIIDVSTEKWGIEIERVELQDIKLPINLQRSMAAEAEAEREAKAKMIAADGEYKASIALKQASDIISQNPVSLQLRYLQTLNTIAAEKKTTVIFPFPMGMNLKDFVKIPERN